MFSLSEAAQGVYFEAYFEYVEESNPAENAAPRENSLFPLLFVFLSTEVFDGLLCTGLAIAQFVQHGFNHAVI
jgi:hypothetical protein